MMSKKWFFGFIVFIVSFIVGAILTVIFSTITLFDIISIFIPAFAGAIAGALGGQYFFLMYTQKLEENRRHVESLLNNDFEKIFELIEKIPTTRKMIAEKTLPLNDDMDCSFNKTFYINFLDKPDINIEKGVAHLKSSSDEQYKNIVKEINNLINASNELIMKWHNLNCEACEKISIKLKENFKDVIIISKYDLSAENAIFIKGFIHDLLESNSSSATRDNFELQIKVDNDKIITFNKNRIGKLKNIEKGMIKPKLVEICEEIFKEYREKIGELEKLSDKLNNDKKTLSENFKRLKYRIELYKRIDGKCEYCP
ncbi:MAG TPA: hypothetical protein ENI33_09545 [Thermoplasmatales archaeon]|nr:hypothetical protein [Thermoplasmatales archaeon]